MSHNIVGIEMMSGHFYLPQKNGRRRERDQAFALVELLVVISIVAIVAGMLFPVLGRAREKSRQSSCLSNMKQLSLALQMYAQDNDELYMSGRDWGRWYWVFLLRPYVAGFPTNHAKPAGGTQACPSNTTLQYLSNSARIAPITPEPAGSWGLGSVTTDNDG